MWANIPFYLWQMSEREHAQLDQVLPTYRLNGAVKDEVFKVRAQKADSSTDIWDIQDDKPSYTRRGESRQHILAIVAVSQCAYSVAMLP
ncbi:hypothetical protein AK812_SmicGene31493 [Symbiodinium microadriaticum]|uniref:Uncharacterized protein n=1 Tax=Symbiodinium microadriaticum TaxID=2951 RepID=A0A1Q9CWL3_SYMMI|nr:hypothetical protein AK812_SmicGene31493 [Symbiodinium microadriaticum]